MVIYRNLPLLKDGNVYSCSNVVDNKLFVMGGCNIEGKAQKSVQFMNLSECKEFIRINDMPRVKAGAAMIHLDSKIITLAGIYNKQCPLDKVDLFDIASSKWQELSSLPIAVQGPIVTIRDNVIYCGGGLTSDMTTINDFHMMDVTAGKWQPLPKMNVPHFNPGSIIHKDNLYVIGGRQGKLSVKSCECFDFRAREWRSLPSIPNEFRNIFSSYVHCDDRIYVIGGMDENPKIGFSNLAYSFDLKTETWEKMPNILKPRADFGAFCVDGKVMVAGGIGQLQGIATSTEIYNPITKRWSIDDDLINMHASSTRVVNDRTMFLIGGMSNTGPSNFVTEIQL